MRGCSGDLRQSEHRRHAAKIPADSVLEQRLLRALQEVASCKNAFIRQDVAFYLHVGFLCSGIACSITCFTARCFWRRILEQCSRPSLNPTGILVCLLQQIWEYFSNERLRILVIPLLQTLVEDQAPCCRFVILASTCIGHGHQHAQLT